MDTYRLTHLRSEDLLRDLASLVAKDRATTALLLAHVAEVDARGLYLRRACSSMHVYCMRELHLSEHEAYLRIHAARAARRFPILFTAVAEGRLHLSAVAALSQHLTRANVGELVEAATHKSKAEVLELLAVRFPQPDMPTRMEPVAAVFLRMEAAPVTGSLQAQGSGELSAPRETLEALLLPETPPALLGPDRVGVTTPVARARMVPLSAGRTGLQFTIDKSTEEKLRHAQALLGREVASGDVAKVLDLALDVLIEKLEKKKLGATKKPRGGQKCPKAGSRRVAQTAAR